MDIDEVGGWGRLSDERKRLASAISLECLINFAREDVKFVGLDRLFVPIFEAIIECDSGRTPPWLTVRVDHHRGTTNRIKITRAKCAGVLQFLMDCGWHQKPAAEFIRESMPRQLRDRTKIRSILAWRETLIGHSDSGDRDLSLAMAETVTLLSTSRLLLATLDGEAQKVETGAAAKSYLAALWKAAAEFT